MTAGGEWGLDCREAEGGLIEFIQSKGRDTPDESDGLIHKRSIIHSNLSHAYQTEYMFLNPGRRHFGACLFSIQMLILIQSYLVDPLLGEFKKNT